MNFLKSGWSYLSNSFTQDEEDEGNYSEAVEPAVETLHLDEGRRDCDINEFVDAVDSSSDDLKVEIEPCDQSHGTSAITGYDGVDDQRNVDQSISTDMVDSNSNNTKDKDIFPSPVKRLGDGQDKTEGYATLEDSDSDSGEFLPPPPKPVGPRVNTESQINQIINNLGEDLAVLELSHGNAGDDTLSSENTLYLTAYDQTICASAEENSFLSRTLSQGDSDSVITSLSEAGITSNGLHKSSLDETSTLRPPTPLFRAECFESECDTPTNQTFDSTSLNNSVVAVTNHDTEDSHRQAENSEEAISVRNILLDQGTRAPTSTISASNEVGESRNAELIVQENHSVMDLKKQETISVLKDKMEDPVDEIPVSRGTYTLNFDNLDDLNPFQTSKGLMNSPDLPSKDFPTLPNTDLPERDTADTDNHIVVDNDIADSTANEDKSAKDACPDDVPESSKTFSHCIPNQPDQTDNLPMSTEENVEEPPVQDAGEEPLPVARGAYTIDFDQLDNFDPFKTSKGLMNSPTKTANFDPFSSSKTLPSTPPKSPVKTATPFKNLQNKEVSNSTIESNKNVEDVQEDSKPSDVLIMSEMGNLENVDPAPKKIAKKPVLGANRKKLAKPKSLRKKPPPVKAPNPDPPEDEDIVVLKGSYSINFDDLDAIDPFKTSKGLSNSPTKTVQEKPFGEAIAQSAPEVVSNDAVAADTTGVSSEVTLDQKIDQSTFEELSPEQNFEEEQKIAKGSYSINFNNLDDFDPFKTSKGLANSPSGEHPSGFSVDFNHKEEQSNSETINKPSGGITKETEDGDERESSKKSESAKKEKKPTIKNPPPIDAESKINDDDEIPISKGSYNLDFDNLDAMDPFKTGKGLSNSPTEKKTSQYSFDLDNLDGSDPFKSSKSMANSPPLSPKKLVVKEEKQISAEEVKSVEESTVTEPKSEVKSPPKQVKKKTGLVKKGLKKRAVKKPPPVDTLNENEDEIPVPKGAYNLDFDNLDAMDPFKTNKGLPNSPIKEKPSGYSIDLDDLDNVDPFKSTKTISNSPATSPVKNDFQETESAESRTEEPTQEKTQKDSQPTELKKPQKKQLARKKLVKPGLKKPDDEEPAEPSVPHGSYNLDFDNLDAFDPFKSAKAMTNSPTKETQATVSGYSADLADLGSANPFQPTKMMKNSPTASPSKQEIFVDAKTEIVPDGVVEESKDVVSVRESMIKTTPPIDKSIFKESKTSKVKHTQQAEFERINENEEFYPANNVFQDSASLDYLDKLADSENFNECKLRKQSLYVKFDPLVSASPEAQIRNQLIKDAIAVKEIREIDDKAAGDHKAAVQNSDLKKATPPNASMDQHSSTDSYRQPNVNRESTSFKHTQADLEAAVRRAELKWQKKHEEHERREESLQAELDQMTKVVSEYDRLFAEMANNGSRNGMLTREQQLLTAEHEQTLEDMASLERSHEDLCRRYNRLKTVLAQFKQNEDILKASTNQMVQEAKDAEKKYVTLKNETDESLRKANEDLHSVKANAQQEVARAQAQLKLLELKCESLQNQVRECSKENEELTKLCDDLIACSKQDG